LDKWVERISEYWAWVGRIAIWVILLVILANVLMRKLFDMPVLGSVEIAQLAIGLGLVAFLALAQIKEGHISADIIVRRLPRRLQLGVKAVLSFLGSVTMLMVAWGSAIQAYKQFLAAERTADIHIPVSPVRFMFAISLFLLVLVLLWQAIKYVLELARPGAVTGEVQGKPVD